MSIIVYGPQGCGKTRHAEELRAHFGLTRVVDDYVLGPLPDDALVLTNIPNRPGALHFWSVMLDIERRKNAELSEAITILRRANDDLLDTGRGGLRVIEIGPQTREWLCRSLFANFESAEPCGA